MAVFITVSLELGSDILVQPFIPIETTRKLYFFSEIFARVECEIKQNMQMNDGELTSNTCQSVGFVNGRPLCGVATMQSIEKGISLGN